MTGADEDRVLERFLEGIDSRQPEAELEDLGADEAGVWREYSELAGLIPYAVDPVVPDPEIRARVLAAVSASPTAAPVQAAPMQAAPRQAAPLPLPFPSLSKVSSSSRALVLLAAALAVMVLGLGIFSASLYRQQQVQSAKLQELSLQIAEASERPPVATAVSYEDVQRLRTLVTAAGGRRCKLAPPSDDPAQPLARGTVIFDSERSEYFLAARDLKPCREGEVYRVWFMVDGKPVPGEAFHVKAGTPVTLGAEGMPSGASGILVTLQSDDGSAEPAGERVLYGDHSEDML